MTAILYGLCLVLSVALFGIVLVQIILRKRYGVLEGQLTNAIQERDAYMYQLQAAGALQVSLQSQLDNSDRRNNQLRLLLEESVRKLADLETSSRPGGLLQKAVTALVGLGVPGLILLSVMATTGFAGAAAITSALATLGGPVGMVGGIAVLIALGLAAKALAEYGYPIVAEAVIRGLVAKGESKESILRALNPIPSWILSEKALASIINTLEKIL